MAIHNSYDTQYQRAAIYFVYKLYYHIDLITHKSWGADKPLFHNETQYKGLLIE